MDVTKPELINVNGICYRINPGNFVSNFDPRRPQTFQYLEDDDAECVVNNESDDEEIDVEVDEMGRCKISFHVAKTYFPHIIGSKGMTRKRLETETKTRITVPKLGQSGNIIVSGIDRKSVLSAKRRIHMIALSARKRQPITHFVSIPFTAPAFREGFQKFKEAVLENCRARGIEEAIFQTVDKLHLTIAIMVLCDNEERSNACSVFEKCKEEIIKPLLDGNPLHLAMRGVDYMNDDPSEIKILYGKVHCPSNPELLQELADKISSFFVQSGLMDKKYEGVKLHVTLMNTAFRNLENVANDKTKEKTTFDGRQILKDFENFTFGEADIERIELSQRCSYDESGYYQSSASVTLPLY